MDWESEFEDLFRPREAWRLAAICVVALGFWVGVGLLIGYLIWG